MLQFDAAPPVPSNYPRLQALTPAQVEEARAAGYVVDAVDPAGVVRRTGIENGIWPPPDDDMRDWRARLYVIWFCFIFENFQVIQKPLYAIEELIFEFKGLEILDTPRRRLASVYAGAGAYDPLSNEQRIKEIQDLRPHYQRAATLLSDWHLRNSNLDRQGGK